MEINCITEYKKIINSQNSSNNILSDSIDKFKITKHKDGSYPAIITISGFTSEDKDNRLDWQDSVLNAYPGREWFHLEWNSKKLPFEKVPMTNKLDSHVVKEGIKINFPKNILKVIVASNAYTRTAYILINNFWHVSVRNSRKTGESLANVLDACGKKEFILIGHSLGARIIYNCLKHSYENQLNTNIVEVHLLGGAVSSNKNKWLPVSTKVKTNIYNYFSNNDIILKSYYRIGMLNSSPVGLSKIINKKVINNDSTKFVKGHTEYIKTFHILKKKK